MIAKTLLLLLCCALAGTTRAQLPHTYTFHLPGDSAASELTASPQRTGRHGRVLAGVVQDRQGAPIPFATIEVRAGGAPTAVFADRTGRFACAVSGDSVFLSVEALGYKPLRQGLVVGPGPAPRLNIRLARGPGLDVYEIQARVPLSDSELQAIRNCVQQNGGDPSRCNARGRYRIGIQI